MHDVVIVGISLLAIFADILLNRSDAASIRGELHDEVKGLRGEAQARHLELLARFNVLEADMRQFYHLTGKLAHGRD